MSASKILGASDEDFLNMTPPPVGGVTAGEEENTEQQEDQEQDQNTEQSGTEQSESTAGNESQLTDAEQQAAAEGEEEDDQSVGDKSSTAEEAAKSQQPGEDKSDPAQNENPGKNAAVTEQPPNVKGKADPQKESTKKNDSSGSEEGSGTDSTPDYASFYKRLIGGPIKANGKDIQLNNEEEVLRMVKMGANYTQKMQALAPHRKILMMLESNGLLDESQLGFLIDLNKKNPDAIKKLVKDSGIDPLDIDVKAESTYRPGNHAISEDEAAFRTTLDDLKSNPHGAETLRVIDKTWDVKSKETLLASPGVMELINEHRENGIYQRVAETIEHRRTTGIIGPQVPFIQAYKAIGEELAKAGKLADLVEPSQSKQDSPPSSLVPSENKLATAVVRKGQPKKQVVNTDKASAAGTTRSTPKKATVGINPLGMSDDDFLKQMQNRV